VKAIRLYPRASNGEFLLVPENKVELSFFNNRKWHQPQKGDTMDISKNGNLFENLFLTCSVYRLRVSISGMTKKLRPQDLGLDPEEIQSKDLITLGSKRLIPKEEIEKLIKIRYRAYKAIESNSMKFTFGSFVPRSRKDYLDGKLQGYKQEFDSAIQDIGNRYEEIRQDMMNRWNSEMISIADKNGKDQEFIFMVMSRIEQAFKPWDQVKDKFHFDWNIYSEINEIAKSFIESVSIGMVEKMKEFAESFREKVENGNLNEANLKAARKFVEEIRMSMEVFESETLTKLMDELESWSMSGTSGDISANESISKSMAASMSGIVDVCEMQVDEIVKESIASISKIVGRLQL